MITHLTHSKHPHPINWLHGCRGKQVHAFKDDVNQLAEANGQISQHIFYDNCLPEDAGQGIYQGILDVNRLNGIQHLPGTRYYICGPSFFIQKQYADLRALGIANEQIFFEEFGPQVLQLN